MTQSQGSERAEVSDLRNIVDRLDLLMHTSSTAGGGFPAGSQAFGEIVADLTERLAALESDVSELRTLVNHLMTIATWQAKVTATLVGEEVGPDGHDGDPDDQPQRYGAHGAPDADGRRDLDAGAGNASQDARSTTLDDDIDDILGTDREPSARTPPPPDFGI